MTKISQLYEEEKIAAINKAVNEAVQNSTFEIAMKMLDYGADTTIIMKSTGLSLAEINWLYRNTVNE